MILRHDLLTDHRTSGRLSSLPRTKRIIDVGCGIRPCPIYPAEEYLCIEPHDEYVRVLNEWRPGDQSVRVIQAEAEALADFPRDDTTVLLLDVIEHLERPRGEKMRDLLEEFEHAVVFTPLGWYEQGDQNPDAWGLNGGYWQKHRSAWQPEDFLKWKTVQWPKWHLTTPVGAILATR
jgi:hypothetical protein